MRSRLLSPLLPSPVDLLIKLSRFAGESTLKLNCTAQSQLHVAHRTRAASVRSAARQACPQRHQCMQAGWGHQPANPRRRMTKIFVSEQHVIRRSRAVVAAEMLHRDRGLTARGRWTKRTAISSCVRSATFCSSRKRTARSCARSRWACGSVTVMLVRIASACRLHSSRLAPGGHGVSHPMLSQLRRARILWRSPVTHRSTTAVHGRAPALATASPVACLM